MGDFFVSQLDYIYFIGGLSFVLLGVTSLFRYRLDKLSNADVSWRWLAMFGFAYGLSLWIDVLSVSLGNIQAIGWIKTVSMVLSFAFLVEFWRSSQLPGEWLKHWAFPIIFCLALIGIFAGILGINLGFYYLLGSTSGLLATVTLYYLAKKQVYGGWHLIIASLAMAALAIIFSLVVPNFDSSLASLISREAFFEFTNFPAPLFSAIFSFVIAFSVWRNYKIIDLKNGDRQQALHKSKSVLLIFFTLLLVLIAGWLLTQWMGHRQKSYLDEQLLGAAEQAKRAVNIDNVRYLSESRTDFPEQIHNQLKLQLQSLRRSFPQIDSLSIVKMSRKQILVLADSGAEGLLASNEYYPTEVYGDAIPELAQAFQVGTPLVSSPFSDKQGTWISALVPIKETVDSKVLSVLIAKSDYGSYLNSIFSKRLLSVLPVMLLCLAIIFIIISQRRYQQLLASHPSDLSSARSTSFGSELVVILVLGAITMAVFFEARESSTRSIENRFFALSGERSKMIADYFDSSLQGLDLVRGLYAGSSFVERQEFSIFVRNMNFPSSRGLSIMWVPKIDKDERKEFEQSAKTEGLKDFEISVRQTDEQLVTAPIKDSYLPVYYSEPEIGRSDLGLDLSSESGLSVVFDKARDSGKSVSSHPLKDKDGSLYFIVASPVYEKGIGTVTVSERRLALKGFIVGRYLVKELVESIILNSIPLGIFFQLESDSNPGSSPIFYQQLSLDSDFDWDLSSKSLKYEYPIDFAGQTIRIVSFPGTSFLENNVSGSQLWVLEIGLLLSLLITMYLRLFLNSKFKTESLVIKRTKELTREKNKLQQYLDVAGIVTLIFDSNGNKVLFINKKGREVLDVSAESIISADWVSAFVSKDGQAATKKAINDLISGKEVISSIQNTILTSNNEEKNIVWRFSRLDSENELMYPVIGAGIDVTELTKAKTTIDQLKELDRLKNEVLNIATHELKTPLISIVGLTEVMEQQKEKLAPEHASYISIIHKEGLKLTNLIKSMLSATRNEKGNMTISKSYFNIDELALSMSTSLSVLAKRTDSKVAVEIKDKSVNVNSDKEKIQEVISNFVDNAVKYGVSGQTIRVVVSKPDKEHVKIEVIGAGQGISEEMQKKLFLKFSQLEPSLSRSQDGMGLGLYICKQVIDSLDGEIGVVSQPGQGATFYFVLPLV